MTTTGSSPLARGLRYSSSSCTDGARIIPARAGFTGSFRVGGTVAGDHPRSRGVYSLIITALNDAGGSSPLARGLLKHHQPPPRIMGIIPARAGFTRHAPLGKLCAEDHPRSRGVYAKKVCVARISVGSSPLARGLLRGLSRLSDYGGIIPARAGFTPSEPS